MADVTGPISTLSGSSHHLPEGTMCDRHPRRKAVARIQGETDSFGSEMNDMCQKCLDQHRAYLKSPANVEHRKGQCEWCKQPAEDLRDRRDFEEGLTGRVYRVCGNCVKKENERLVEEASEHDDDRWYDDDYGDDE
jgi:hypothetical protein